MTELRKFRPDRGTLLVFAVLIASFVINIFLKIGFDFEYMRISPEDFTANNQLSSITVIMYVLFTRLKQFIVIVLLMKILNTEVVYNVILIILGFIFGIMITVQTFYSGISGIGELILYMIPHYIIYLYLIYLLYIHYKNWMKETFQLPKIMFFIVLFCSGVICEGFFSRIFLENFFQHIVVNI